MTWAPGTSCAACGRRYDPEKGPRCSCVNGGVFIKGEGIDTEDQFAVAPGELGVVDYLRLARCFLWVANKSLAEARSSDATQAAVRQRVHTTSEAIAALDRLTAELTDVPDLPVTAGLPPGRNNVMGKLYGLVLAGFDGTHVTLGASSLSVVAPPAVHPDILPAELGKIISGKVPQL